MSEYLVRCTGAAIQCTRRGQKVKSVTAGYTFPKSVTMVALVAYPSRSTVAVRCHDATSVSGLCRAFGRGRSRV